MVAVTADPKILERVGKLLRLGAPSGGSTEAERTSALLEAARLIDEHGLVIAPPPPPKERKRKRPPPPSTVPIDPDIWIRHVRWVPPSASNWTASTVQFACECCACHRPLHVGDDAWVDPHFGYRCYDIGCTD